MSQLVTSRGVGQYRSAETHLFVTDRMYKRTATHRGIIYCHGAGSTAIPADGGFGGAQILALAAAGYPVISCDLGGTLTWGNDTAFAAVDDAWAYLKSAFGAKTDKVGLIGVSMGALTALGWARQHLSSVFAVAASIPVLDLDDVYQGNKGSYRADIGTAHGVTYPTTIPTLSTRSPVAFGSSDLAGLPLKCWSSSNDPIATVTSLASAWAGAGSTKTVVDLGAVGHNGATIDPQAVVQHFDDHGGRS